MWTLREASDLVGDLQETVRGLEYHILLGGGVLYRGESEKDLDLFFCPLNGHTPECHWEPGVPTNRQKLFSYLNETFGPLKAMRDSPDYAAGSAYYWEEMLFGSYLGRRVDIFIR